MTTYLFRVNTIRSGLTLIAGVFMLGYGNGCHPFNPDQPFGETAIVMVVNPTINDGNSVAPPANLGDFCEGVHLDANPGGSSITDETGLAVLDELAAGDMEIVFEDGPVLPFNIISKGDVYDVAVAYDGNTVSTFSNFPIRYGIGGDILRFTSNAPAEDLALALSGNNNIVFFRNGQYNNDLEITGDNVIFFGEGFTKRDVIIDGSILVRGTGVRIRGFTITGNITVLGNDFGMAYCSVKGATDIRGNAVAFLRNAFCGPVTVPSSNATLLDNEGIVPLPLPPDVVCP